jgi:two-component system, cell cycle sensor histidine kinase and response regulator CckA
MSANADYGPRTMEHTPTAERKSIEPHLMQQQLQIAIEAAGAGVWHMDVQARKMTAIQPTGPMTGLPAALRPSTLESFLALVHSEDRDAVDRGLQRAFSDGTYKAEFRIVLPDGAVRWVAARGQCRRDADGKPLYLTGIDLDIGEWKRLEQQFRQAQKMEAVGQLAGGIAHDFNNVLTVVQGNASLLLEVKALSEEDLALVRQITEAAERATALTRQLLLFGRKQVLQSHPVKLNEIVGNMTKMLKRILGEDITLQSDFAPSLPAIRADLGMIEQIILNLAVNARDAMPRGGSLRITSTVETVSEDQSRPWPDAVPGHYVCLDVRDSGSGIAPEHLPHIFEPFFTTKEVGKGTGLGLATVYGIVKQHGGGITVESQLEKGTTFRIYLPVAPPSVRAPRSLAPDAKLPAGKETLLVVEDESAVRMLVVSLLQRCGYRVLEAESGMAALELWKKSGDAVDLLLTDMIMPGGMTGRELAEKLRAEKPGLKVIYTSGYSPDILEKAPLPVEGCNFLQKPYQPLKLAQTVRNCLDGK